MRNILIAIFLLTGCDCRPCACGHYETRHTILIAGKVIIPQTQTIWVCEARIPERCDP